MTIQYCVKRFREQDGKIYYMNISHTIKTVQAYIEKNEKIYEIEVSETNEIDEDTYYGWLEPEGNVLSLVDICFAYGYKAEQDSGKGKLIRVKIEEICECK